MTKYKTDIAAAASSMMELPGTLEGMLHDIHGQVEVSRLNPCSNGRYSRRVRGVKALFQAGGE